jgi:hypothetical protein
MQTKIEKKIALTVETIEAFFSKSFYEVNCTPPTLDKAVAKTERKVDGFHFEFAKMASHTHEQRNSLLYAKSIPVTFSNKARKIQFELQETSYQFNEAISGSVSIIGKINEFTTNSLEKFQNAFYRSIVITESSHALSGFFSHNNILQIGTKVYGSGVLELNIRGISLHLFAYTSKETNSSYFIIESRSKCQYVDFVSMQDEIILAIAYLTGTFLGNEIYIVGSETETFEENYVLALKRFFDDLKSGYAAIPDITLQHQLNAAPQRFSVSVLEKLIHEILDSLMYKRALLLICQGHTEPPYVTSSLYSVALETITNRISEEIAEKIRPIGDPEVAKAVRGSLQRTLDTYKESISEDAFKKITSDIERLNSPTNKQKLTQPFQHFAITLSTKDIIAIEKRNDFLHGRIPDDNDRHALPLINGRLLYCINSLVLKHAGHKGYVLYFPSIYQFKNHLKVEEGVIRTI